MTITDRVGNVPEGLGIKAPCLVATTANITLSGLQTIDGVLLVANDRVLVWQQTDQTTNGIYQASTGNWTRPNDVNNNESFIAGTEVIVVSGSTYAGEQFYVTCADDPVIIGTSLLTWAALSATIPAGSVTYAKIQKVTASRLLGNPVGSPASGVAAEIALGATFALVGAGTLQTVAMTGDVRAGSNSFVTTISAGAVTYAKMQTVSASRLLGNPTAATASAAEISLGATFALVGAGALQTLSGTGDVTWASNSFATTISNAAVTLAKMSSLAASSFIGNSTGSASTPTAVTASTIGAMIASVGQSFNFQPSDPTGTATATGAMMGLGATCVVTPSYSSRLNVTFCGVLSNTASGDGANIAIRYGTGTAPINGVAPTGTSIGQGTAATVAAANQNMPFSMTAVITGLTAGTQYWLDLRLLALTGGTASAAKITCSGFEF